MQLGLWIVAVLLIIAFAVLKPMLTGRDSYSGSTLKPGVSTSTDVTQTMGEPKAVWKTADGRVEQMAFPRGPAGYVTFMVHFADNGTVQRVEQVLDEMHFARVTQGMTPEDVLRILGPARSTNVFAAKNQLYWNYGYCSEHGKRMEYAVQFDNTTQRVTGSVTISDPLVNATESGFCAPWVNK